MIGIVAPVIALEEYVEAKGDTISQICLHPGGQGVHLARVIKEFGEQCVLASFVGGELAPVMRALLEQYQVAHRLVTCAASTAAVLKLTSDGSETAVWQLPPSKVSRHESDNLFEAASLLILDCEVVVFSGTLVEGMPRDFFARLVCLANRHGVRTVVDVAPEFLEKAVQARPTVVKPGLHQLSRLFSLDPELTAGELAQAARQLCAWGAETVVVSQTGEGAVAVGPDWAWKLVAPALESVGQAGAGDCMTGVIAVGLSRGWPREEILKTAVGAAAGKVLRRGLGICKRDVAMALREQVQVISIPSPDGRSEVSCRRGSQDAPAERLN
ncbi:MAG: PfkB family carbohydrate kinase [Chloroflexi bacterium]|nr:PfkB family carbohydrate kinase [Chloroflexota bacterium]